MPKTLSRFVTSCALRVAGSTLQDACCELRGAGFGFRAEIFGDSGRHLPSVFGLLSSVFCFTFTNICLGVIFDWF